MAVLLLTHYGLVLLCSSHVLLRRHRQPEARAAWLLLLVALPYLGLVAYLLFGSTSIGRKRIERFRAAAAALPAPEALASPAPVEGPDGAAGLFDVGRSLSGYAPVGGNRAELMADSDAAIDRIVNDIDRAESSVHLLFYIWLDDTNGRKVADALKRAAGRGVMCRAMVDDIGSRAFIKGPQWRALAGAGVATRRALAVGNPLWRAIHGRIDLRDHRKIVVIDNRITYCGSQNCADPAFLPKARFGPWVDILLRLEGPVVRQNQHLFASGWMANGGDDIAPLLREPLPAAQPGFVAQVVAAGPTYRSGAMPQLFASLIYASQRNLTITTPYYVPTEGLHSALCAAAQRGVETAIIFPARNDDFAVGGICRGHYESLLEAGVKVFEFAPGLLHAKTLTIDGHTALIGSANLDRRSFDLNFENNILICDRSTVGAICERQDRFREQSRPVSLGDVKSWGIGQRLWNNVLSMMAAVL